MPLILPNYDKYDVPEHARESLDNYFVRGYKPGSFMEAVICNDLFNAVCRADSTNRSHLHNIIMWMINNAPPAAYGNPIAYKNWLNDTDKQRTNFAKKADVLYVMGTLKGDFE